MSDQHDQNYLTPTQAAQILMVSPITVRQWAQKGLLPYRTTPGGHRRFLEADVRQFADRLDRRSDQQRRVLIVDDDRQLATFLCTLFQAQDGAPAVDVAYDGFEAGRMLQRFKPDTVVLDIMMPGMDGIEVCRRLKEDRDTTHIRVVAITGQANEEIESRMRSAGAEAFLAKPFSNAELLAACGFSQTEGARQDDQFAG